MQQSAAPIARFIPGAASLARLALLLVALVGLGAGVAMWAIGRAELSRWAFAAGALPVLAALLVEIVRSLRRGDYGLDVIAALSMGFSLLLGEHLAAVVVALMYAGGAFLEAYAEGRANRELTRLLAQVPRSALRRRGSDLEEIALSEIAIGNVLLVRRGEMVPVDGTLDAGRAVLDTSALTGEALPLTIEAGGEVLSGAVNAADAFDLVATATAERSTLAGIVRLVAEAQQSQAPMTRIADGFANWFLLLTLVLAGLAWVLSGDPFRALAVLVVATPCPLILAVPVAVVSGISRAAKIGVLVKGGGALEAMANIDTLIIDKTGTLTHGEARFASASLDPAWSEDEVVRLAASLDQASSHVVARALVGEAISRGLRLEAPADIVEYPGEGLVGRIGGTQVSVGGHGFVLARSTANPSARRDTSPGLVAIAVAVDGRLIGILHFADRLRDGAGSLLDRLRAQGISRIVLATGDRRDIAEAIVDGLPIDEIRADLDPGAKTAIVRAELRTGRVMMIGDGINDAPALAAATVGVAMGARGAAASAEAADAVVLVDDLDRVAGAIGIAQRSRDIALQSVVVGLGLSGLGMVVAALGYLQPVQGALVQEAIDVAVILNALRVLRPGPAERSLPPSRLVGDPA